jgi:hypothetical protein
MGLEYWYEASEFRDEGYANLFVRYDVISWLDTGCMNILGTDTARIFIKHEQLNDDNDDDDSYNCNKWY